MKNEVQLIGWYGGDERIALAAWTSTSRELSDEKRARIPALIKMLADNRHMSPFRKSFVEFLCTVDQPTAKQMLKHRVGVEINSESARYRELEDKAYIPEEWRGTDWGMELEYHARESQKLYHQALAALSPVLGRKRAKETARYFLPECAQVRLDVTMSFEAFLNFQRLRNSEHAQVEIREVAQQMLELVRGIEGQPFKATLEAFGL